jgi:hypothetical protein
MRELLVGLAVAAAAFAMIPPASAGLDVDFGAAVALDDDTQIFLRVSSRHFDADHGRMEAVHHRLGRPEDAAVAFFIARHAGVAVNLVLKKRDKGLSWYRIALKLGVHPDVFFVPLRRHPGPPYGNAYGHWKKHKHAERHDAWKLHDDDIRELVTLRIASDYYRLSPDEVVRRRGSRTGVVQLVSGEYRSRHGKAKKAVKTPPGHAGHPGKGHAKGKGAHAERN